MTGSRLPHFRASQIPCHRLTHWPSRAPFNHGGIFGSPEFHSSQQFKMWRREKKKGTNDYSIGWGRRSKKRPKRTDSAGGEASVAADLERGTLESATSPIREITPPNEITRADSQEGSRLQEICPANDNARYHLHHTPQDCQTPESTNPSPPVLEPLDSLRYNYPRTVSCQRNQAPPLPLPPPPSRAVFVVVGREREKNNNLTG